MTFGAGLPAPFLFPALSYISKQKSPSGHFAKLHLIGGDMWT